MRRAAHAPFLSHRAEFAGLVAEFLLGTGEVGEVVRDGSAQRADTPDADTKLAAEVSAVSGPVGIAAQGTAAGASAARGSAADASAMREVGKAAARQAVAQMALSRQMPGSASGADTVAPVVADVSAAGESPSSEPQRAKNKRIKGRAKKKMQRRHQ
jgi:hypothetical protein